MTFGEFYISICLYNKTMVGERMEKIKPEIRDTASVLKLLGDNTRLSIVGLVQNHECCVCEFVELLDMSQSSVSQHLRKLRDAGLVKEQRKGYWIFYSFNQAHPSAEMVEDILRHVPDQNEKLQQLERDGLRINCD